MMIVNCKRSKRSSACRLESFSLTGRTRARGIHALWTSTRSIIVSGKSSRPASASRLCRKRSASANDAGISADGSPVRIAWACRPSSPSRWRTTFFSGGVLDFWTEPQMASIHKMLNPRSIAIVGATPRMQYGGRFLAAALKAKDRVRVYAVNPRYDEIMGEKSYPSVTDLPEAPDVVAVVVPYDQVLDVLQESHRKGAGSAIVISAGFGERGADDRGDLQGELGEFARASGMRISGPNCLGLANVKDDIWATASSRGAEGLSGPIGLVCQSGATAFRPFLVRAVENGIGI